MPRKVPLYRKIAQLIDALHRCEADPERYRDAIPKHQERLATLERNHLPRGAGIDSGTTIDTERSTGEKLVFCTSFHHMNDVGMYDGWTEHTVTVRPSLIRTLAITVGGRDRNMIKDYLHELFDCALRSEVEL